MCVRQTDKQGKDSCVKGDKGMNSVVTFIKVKAEYQHIQTQYEEAKKTIHSLHSEIEVHFFDPFGY